MQHPCVSLPMAAVAAALCIAGCSSGGASLTGEESQAPDLRPGYASADGSATPEIPAVPNALAGSENIPPGASTFRGIPEPSSVLGFDVWADYQADRTITGSRGADTLTCKGSEADPCVIDASGASFTKLGLSGAYVILDGGLVNAGSGRGDWFSSRDCRYCVIRDLEVAGPGTDSGHSSAVGLGQYNVWIRGSIHGFGDNRRDAGEQDFHGMKLYGRNQWVLDAEIYDVSGDSVQVGDASRGSAELVYIGGGYFHDNRENAVDIKDSHNVVISGVRMKGFLPTRSSSGVALVIHDDAFDAQIYDNVIGETTLGIVSSGVSGHVIAGNDITAWDVGIQLRHTRNITVIDNEIDAPRRIQMQGAVTGDVQN